MTKYYIYFDNTRDWESYLSMNPHWADDDDEGWYLGGIAESLSDVFSILEEHGFDYEYIYNFIEYNISHEEYIELKRADDKRAV